MNAMQAQYNSMAKLNNRHREIIRLAIMGWTGTQIADHIGMARAVVYCILRSPLAQMEITRLNEEANKIAANLPYRVIQEKKLREISDEAVNVNRDLMNDKRMDPRVRSRISMHFQDRNIYDRDGDDKPGSYREILRKLDEVATQIRNGEVIEALPEPIKTEEAEIISPRSGPRGVPSPTVEQLHEMLLGKVEPREEPEEKMEIVKFHDRRFKP